MDDLISRQDAIEAIRNLYPDMPKIKFMDNVSNWQKKNEKYIECENAIFALPSVQPERKTEKALRLLVEWAVECDFGYDNIPEEYEKYKDDIADMGYIDGLIYIAKMELEHERHYIPG